MKSRLQLSTESTLELNSNQMPNGLHYEISLSIKNDRF